MMDFIDISMPITADVVSWADRFPPTVTWHSRISDGQATTNSSWQLHSHTGTHLDAPLHHIAGGRRVKDIPLERMIGTCTVLDLTGAAGQIGPEELRAAGLASSDRVLLKTRNSSGGRVKSDTFDEGFVGITPDGARLLIEVGTVLVGIDYLSIEPYGSVDFPTHCQLLASETVVVEGLDLSHVEPGKYTLVFLPIALSESEAAPGRAILFASSTKGSHHE